MKTYIAALILAGSYSNLSLAQTTPLGPNEIALTCKFGQFVQQVRGPKNSAKPLTLVFQTFSGYRAVASVLYDGRGYITDGYVLENANSTLPKLLGFTSSRASRFYLGGTPFFGCSRDPL